MSSEYTNECEHFDDGRCDKFYDVMCYEHPECKYKQIQKLQQCLSEIEKYCEEQNLKYDTTACDILRIIKEVTGNE